MKYYEKIDGIRFIAITSVLVHHTASIFSTYIDLGYFGVDLFFVLSGFLITTILLKSDGSFKKVFCNFLVRRSLRIFPLYYFSILLLTIIGNPVVLDNLIYLLTYTFNYKYPFIDINSPVDHFWSLSVEEQFYLFWPIIVLSLRTYPKILLFVVVSIISFSYIQISFNLIPSISIFNYTGLPARMGSLGLGSFGAIIFIIPSSFLLFILHSEIIEYIMYVVCILSLIFLTPFLMGISSLFLVLKAAENSYYSNSFNNFLSNKFVVYIGKISYGLYVYHVIIIYYFTPYFFDPIWNSIRFDSLGYFRVLKYHSWVFKLPLYSIITVVISELSYRYFEQPILLYKDRFFRINSN
ncbi:MAG: peptidoglycan/LPS O-acetylase OafA/YrhL [Psychroserpens sp.]|jgi:peptidoglycan/LPS O-acetylase OafA/YrhL